MGFEQFKIIHHKCRARDLQMVFRILGLQFHLALKGRQGGFGPAGLIMEIAEGIQQVQVIRMIDQSLCQQLHGAGEILILQALLDGFENIRHRRKRLFGAGHFLCNGFGWLLMFGWLDPFGNSQSFQIGDRHFVFRIEQQHALKSFHRRILFLTNG